MYHLIRKVTAALLCTLLVLATVAYIPFASAAQQPSISATVRVETTNSTYLPPTTVTVDSSKPLSAYGISGNPTDHGYISCAHVLAQAMLARGMDVSKLHVDGDYLSDIEGTLGADEFYMFRINDTFAYYDEQTGLGSTFTDYRVKDGDVITIYAVYYQDSEHFTKGYAMFEQADYQVVTNAYVDVQLKADSDATMMGGGQIAPVYGADILVSKNGSPYPEDTVGVQTDESGTAALLFSQPGTYTISAYKGTNDSGCEISRPYATVTVTDGDSEQNLHDVCEAADKIVIDELQGSDLVYTSLTLPTRGSNGCSIEWSSSDASLLTSDGILNRPLDTQQTVTLTATVKKGSSQEVRSFVLRLPPVSELDSKIELNQIVNALSDYRPAPVFGRDTNIVDVVKEKLSALGHSDVSVALVSTDNPQAIASDGTIFYYRDFSDVSAMNRGAYQVQLSFTLGLNGVYQRYIPKQAVSVGWDRDAVLSRIQTKEASNLTWDMIRGENETTNSVTRPLTLPSEMPGDFTKLSFVTWHSSDPSVISIQGDFLSGYSGSITRPLSEDATVRLTACFDFRFAGSDSPIQLTKTFSLTVPAQASDDAEAVTRELDAALSSVYSSEALCYSQSKTPIDPEKLTYDIQLPTSNSGGYPIGEVDPGAISASFSTSDESVLQVNGYRVYVNRPLPGEQARTANLTVTLSKNGISRSKTLPLTAAPLTQEELEREAQLMAQAKAHLFDAIRGQNESPDSITKDLTVFQEVHFDQEGELSWVYSASDKTGTGIIAVPIDPDADPLVGSPRFDSDHPTVITPENLLVTRPEQDTVVCITACLSSERYERYALQYPENELLRQLCRQPVELLLTVKAAAEEPEGPMPDAVLQSLTLKFSATTSEMGAVPLPDAFFHFDPAVTEYSILTDYAALDIEKLRRVYVYPELDQPLDSCEFYNSLTSAYPAASNYAVINSFGAAEFRLIVRSGAASTTYTFHIANADYITQKIAELSAMDDTELVENDYIVENLASYLSHMTPQQAAQVDSHNRIAQLQARLVDAVLQPYMAQNYETELAIRDAASHTAIIAEAVTASQLHLKLENSYSDYTAAWTCDSPLVTFEPVNSYDTCQAVTLTRPQTATDLVFTLTLSKREDPSFSKSHDYKLTLLPITESEITQAQALLSDAVQNTRLIFAPGEDADHVKTVFAVSLPEKQAGYEIQVISSDTETIELNSYSSTAPVRAVNRPDLYQPDKQVTISFLFTHSNLHLTMQKDFVLTVLAYQAEEVQTVYADLCRAARELPDALIGNNISLSAVTQSLTPVTGAEKNADGSFAFSTGSSTKPISIEWIASSAPDYIGISSWNLLEVAKRPDLEESDQQITLTAQLQSSSYFGVVPPVEVSIPVTLKAYNTYLQSLSLQLDGIAVPIAFDKAQQSYELLTDSTAESLTISAIPENPAAHITINEKDYSPQDNTYALTNGHATITLTVLDTASYIPKTRTYQISVYSRPYLNACIAALPQTDSEIPAHEDAIRTLYATLAAMSPQTREELDAVGSVEQVYQRLLALVSEREEQDLRNRLNAYLDENYQSPITYQSGDYAQSVTRAPRLKTESFWSDYEAKWTSSSESIVSVSTSGSVTLNRPPHSSGPQTVTLTLSLSVPDRPDITATRSYSITVQPYDEAESSLLQQELEACASLAELHLEDNASLDQIMYDLTYSDASYQHGLKTTWTSSQPDVVLPGSGASRSIRVCRPFASEGARTVIITASVTKDGFLGCAQREFVLTVLPYSAQESEAITARLQNALSACMVTDEGGTPLSLDSIITRKIKLVSGSDSQVDIRWELSDTDAISDIPSYAEKVLTVTRPNQGEPDAQAVLTVIATDKQSSKQAIRQLNLTVKAISQDDRQRERELAEQAASGLCQAIRGSNADLCAITDDLYKPQFIRLSEKGFDYTAEDTDAAFSILWDGLSDTVQGYFDQNFLLTSRPHFGEPDAIGTISATVTSLRFPDISASMQIPITICAYTNTLDTIMVDGEPVAGFEPDRQTCVIDTDMSSASVSIAAVCYDPAAMLSLNGSAISSGEQILCQLSPDSDTVITLSVQSAIAAEPTEYTLIFRKAYLTAQWPSWRGSDTNIARTDASLPRNAGEAAPSWQTQLTQSWDEYATNAIIVDHAIYVAAKDSLLRIDQQGQTAASARLSCDLSYNSYLVYGEGKIFVSYDGGRLEAFDAASMQSLFVTEPVLDTLQYAATPLTYSEGYVYFGTSEGFSSASGYYLCIDANTGDLIWCNKSDSMGYYWAGAVVVGDALIYGNDAGQLVSVDKKTGRQIDSFTADDAIRSTIAADRLSLYFTTKSATLYRLGLNSDLTFDKQHELHTRISYTATESTSTPAIANGRVYVGGKTATGGVVSILDADTLALKKEVAVRAAVQSSPLLCTAYAGRTYVYVTYNDNPGGIVVIEDDISKGQVFASELYTPKKAQQNFCAASIIADSDANLYYKNDSGYFMAISKCEADAQKVLVSFQTAPNNAALTVLDSQNRVIEPIADRTYYLPAGSYSYRAEASGYDNKTAAFTVSEADISNQQGRYISVSLTKSGSSSGSSGSIRVTFRLEGDTVHNTADSHDKTLTWIKTTSYTMPEGSSVFDLFDKALGVNGLSYREGSMGYISAIQAPQAQGGFWLEQFDNGPLSGWMYRVNGVHVQSSARDEILHENDQVVWHYTDDFTAEDSYNPEWSRPETGGPSSGGGHSGGITETPDDDKDPVENEPLFPELYFPIAFTDVAVDHWAKPYIDSLSAKGIVSGKTATSFAPDDLVTRAEFITLLHRISLDTELYPDAGFSDVPEGAYYEAAVNWGVAGKVIYGVDEVHFDPDSRITREDMAVMTARFLTQIIRATPADSTQTHHFSDSDEISGYAVDAVMQLRSLNMLDGNEYNQFLPKSGTIRSEAAKLVCCVVDYIEQHVDD